MYIPVNLYLFWERNRTCICEEVEEDIKREVTFLLMDLFSYYKFPKVGL